MSQVVLSADRFALYTPAGRTLLQKVSLTLNQGEVLCLQGPNGSGKSTFLRHVFTMLSEKKRSNLTDSSLLILGHPSFAYLPQSLNREFFVPLSLGEVANLHSLAKVDSSFGIESLLDPRLRRRSWDVASGGEKQRALLIQTLSQNVAFYLLDEPFNHLDSQSIEVVANIMGELAAKKGATFLVATHVIPPSLNQAWVKRLQFKAPHRVGEVTL